MTNRDKEVLEYIIAFRAENGISPTLREIGAGVHLRSPSSVQRHIIALEKEGLLKCVPDKMRAMVPVVQRG